jgi:hypothetical protein
MLENQHWQFTLLGFGCCRCTFALKKNHPHAQRSSAFDCLPSAAPDFLVPLQPQMISFE